MAKQITSRIQHGSLPVYLATMAGVATVAAATFATSFSTKHLIWFDHPLQLALALAISAAAVAGAFVNSRLGAALTLGAVGIAMSGIFVVHGAPDLALTQLLIETIIVVGFVVGLGHLTRQFPHIADTWRNIRIAISILGGAAITIALAAAGANPAGAPPIDELATETVSTGGGNNIVNVILTDTRALDTLGEVVVLATVALGILALAKAHTNRTAPDSGTPKPQDEVMEVRP
jgi:multicomponent Na+:H+ antiporter subunit A